MLQIERDLIHEEKGMKKGRNDERQETIRKLVKRSRSMKQTDDEIMAMLMDLFPSSEKMIRESLMLH